ncbi:hypothetical protein QM012_004584 [Aureobasidium pullulans]|uniref:BRCT domain-containing protein n=1 Tax=Aureobasidium pullulans TaxID=5580 RepID=A0ABR0TTI8_AURPU
MPSWHVNLLSHSGKRLDSHREDITSHSHATIFIDGETADADTWRFVGYSDETQARRDWISQFTFVGGVLQFSSKIVDTFVLTPPPVQALDSRIRLPFTADGQQFCVLLRHGDTVEFGVTQSRVEIVFDATLEDFHIQVESSGPGKVKHEIKEEPDTDGETDDETVQPVMDVHRGTSVEESQHLFSTSREHPSPTPRQITRESQVVKDTPNRRRVRSQHESAIPESLPMEETNLDRPQPTGTSGTADVDNGITSILPDVHTGELPDTSPSESLHFHVPTQHTPSPLDQSFSAAEVGKLISNLHNTSSQMPPSTSSPTKTRQSDVIASQLSYNTPIGVAERTNPPKPQFEPPAAELAAPVLEDVASPVDIINDQITNDRNRADGSNDSEATASSDSGTAASVKADTVAPSVKQTPLVLSTGKKRKKGSESSSVILSTKRAKLIEGDASATGSTPLSTASKRSSGRGKGLETPFGSVPTRNSSRRKSLDEELPPSTISRRVSTRHKSIDSESAPSGSPSKTGRRYSGEPPVVLYSNTKITERLATIKLLKKHGASITEDIKSANFLCVGPCELLKTPKLLHSLTLGKTIVTDDWVSKSVAAGFLLDTSEFLPEELKATKHLDRTKIFSGQVIYVTPAQRSVYKRGWDDVMAIIRQAGGTNPLTGPLSKLDTSSITLYIGADKDDNVAAKLQEQGEKVYKKDILGASIVQGELLLADESLELPPAESVLPEGTKVEPKSAKKGGRKKKT